VLALRDSRGFVLAQDDDSRPSLIAGPGTSADAEIAEFVLPATDTYGRLWGPRVVPPRRS